MLDLSKNSQSLTIICEVTCELHMDGDYMNFGEWDRILSGKHILLAKPKLLVMLYLHGEEFQVLGYMTDCL